MQKSSRPSELGRHADIDAWRRVNTEPANQLHAAIMRKSKSDFKRLMESFPLDAPNNEGRNALHLAVLQEDADIVKLILKRRFNVNAQDRRGFTPLHMAAGLCNFKVFETLIRAGSDPRILTADESNVFHLALYPTKPQKNALKIIKLVAETCAIDVNRPNAYGDTPLTIASSRGHSDAVVLLLKLRADCNICDGHGENPLFHAINQGNIPMVKCLLEHNSDINVRNVNGVSLVDAAKAKPEIYDTIRKFMSTLPGGDRRMRQVVEEPIIIARCLDELPPDVKKFVIGSELRPESVNAHWDVFCNVLHFVAKKRVVISEEEAAKAREKNRQRTENPSASSSSHSNINIQKLTIDLITQGSPKDVFKKLTTTGKGGFGMVYSALAPDKSKVAIKRMPHSSERDKRQNLKEVKFLTELAHPNIVKLRAAYEAHEDHEIWVVMELLEGGTLDEAVDEDYEFQEKHIAFVAKEILQGLHFLHSRGVAHRDLKAANIMMSIEGEIKLIDFGLAVDLSAGPRTEMVGSPFWMPPEMIMKRPHTYTVDIWSMAICILELANKEPPNSDSALRSMFNVCCEQLPGLDKADKWSPEFKAFLSRCIVREPEHRTGSAQLLTDPFLRFAAKQADMKHVLRQIFMGNQLKENGFF